MNNFTYVMLPVAFSYTSWFKSCFMDKLQYCWIHYLLNFAQKQSWCEIFTVNVHFMRGFYVGLYLKPISIYLVYSPNNTSQHQAVHSANKTIIVYEFCLNHQHYYCHQQLSPCHWTLDISGFDSSSVSQVSPVFPVTLEPRCSCV